MTREDVADLIADRLDGVCGIADVELDDEDDQVLVTDRDGRQWRIEVSAL